MKNISHNPAPQANSREEMKRTTREFMTHHAALLGTGFYQYVPRRLECAFRIGCRKVRVLCDNDTEPNLSLAELEPFELQGNVTDLGDRLQLKLEQPKSGLYLDDEENLYIPMVQDDIELPKMAGPPGDANLVFKVELKYTQVGTGLEFLSDAQLKKLFDQVVRLCPGLSRQRAVAL